MVKGKRFETDPEGFVRALIERTRSGRSATRVEAFEAIAELASSHYDGLAPFSQELIAATIPPIKEARGEEDDDDAVLQAIEFWSTVAETEETSEHSHGLTRRALPALVEALTTAMQRQTAGQEEDDEAWTPAAAASTCLAAVAKAVPDEIVQAVAPFVAASVASADWHARDAALMAIGATLEGSDGAVEQFVSSQNTLGSLLVSMRDPVAAVRHSAAWVIGRIFLLHHSAIVSNAETLSAVLGALVNGIKTDSPAIVGNCSWAIRNFAESTADSDVLTRAFDELADGLLFAAARPGFGDKTLSHVYEVLCSLVSSAASECHNKIKQIADTCATMLDGLLSSNAASAGEKASYVAGAITECNRKLGDSIAPDFDRFFALFMMLFNQGACPRAREEAVTGFGAIVVASGRDNSMKLLPQLVPVLLQCLRNAVNEADVCQAAVGTIGDLSRQAGAALAGHSFELMSEMFRILQNPEVDRDLKPYVLSCVGDIATGIGASFLPFLSTTMTMLVQATSVDVDMGEEEEAEYIEKLHVSICEALTGILQGLKGSADDLSTHAPTVMKIIGKLYSKDPRSDELKSRIAGTIGDLAQTLEARLAPLLAQSGGPLQTIVSEIKQTAETSETAEVAEWAARMLAKVNRS